MSKDNMPDKIVVKDFRSLLVYQKAMMLAKQVYEVVKELPDEERYAMCSQMRRAVTSISANVAEGQSNLYNKKELSFISNALGSAGEMRCWYEHCINLGYITQEQFVKLDADTEEIMKMLVGYAKRLRQEINNEYSQAKKYKYTLAVREYTIGVMWFLS